MIYDRNKAEASMEKLKDSMLAVISEMGKAGKDLAAAHPRYAREGERMERIAEQLQRRCEEALFSISLSAAFQSGKSTTVNAIADGREICPRGNGGGGIRTSSCAVRVSCALDGRVGSTVVWQTPEELDGALRYALDEQNAPISLSNPRDVQDAWEKLALRTAAAVESPQDFDERSRDQIKQAFLILTFFDDPAARAYMSRTQFSEAETRRFMAFSSDVISRWNAVFQAAARLRGRRNADALRAIVRDQFTVEQAMYVFISMVNYATPSEYLRSLGVQVVDTPGLNMSDNDTRVALRAMQESSAIFYFFTGERQLDEADRAALRLIQTSGLDDKVFFGINFRKPLGALGKIEGAILAELEMLGYALPHQKQMLHYNAFLAQRAKQGRLIQEGALDEESAEAILREAQEAGFDCDSVEQAWLETTDAVMYAVRGEGYREFRELGLCEESISLALAASRWTETMDAINDYVLRNRGSSLLVNGLSKPVRKTLSAVEAVLEADEAEADKVVGDLVGQYDDAIRRYDEFCAFSEGAMQEAITEDWDQTIAEDYYDKVYAASGADAARIAAREITAATTLKRNLGQMGNMLGNRVRKIFGREEKKSELEIITENAISHGFAKAIDPRNIAWQEGFESSAVYRTTIQNSVRSLNNGILLKWSQMGMDENEALRRLRGQLEDKMPTGSFKADFDMVRLTIDDYEKLLDSGSHVLSWVSKVVSGVSVGTAAMAGAFMIYVYVLPADFVLPGVAEIALLLSVAIAAATLFVKQFDKSRAKKDAEKLEKELSEKFNEALSNPGERARKIRSLIDGADGENGWPGLKFYRLFYQGAFEGALRSCRMELEAGKHNAEAAKSQSEEERRRIAADAAEIRTGIIAPMRKTMEELEESVRRIVEQT